MSDEIKELTVSGRPSPRSPRWPASRACSRLREDGLHKVRAGVTSIEEIARVTT